jgi:hypothetical protein
MCLIGSRYYNKSIIPKIIINKYLPIKDNIFGINEYLTFLNTNIYFNDENNYKK